MHESWGSIPFHLEHYPIYQIFDPFNWHLISILSVYGRQTFFRDALCHHKSVESAWFICRNLAFPWEYAFSFLELC